MASSVWNRILRVDLSSGAISTDEPGEDFFRKYLGGRNLIGHYLLTELPRGIDAFDPANRLVFAMGPLTGVPVPGGGRHSVGAKSPLTGFYGEAESGGFWGAELKQAGWDGIVIQGKAERPVFLWIKGREVEIRDAAQLWGKLTGPVEEAIREELGDARVRVTQIGPAGENLVRFACIVNDLNEFAGRTGLGAVMGSKNLKAIAVRGGTGVPVADPAPIREAARWVARETLGEGGRHYDFHMWGTGGTALTGKHLEGHLIVHNFRDGQLNGASNLDAVSVVEKVGERMGACFACPIRCKKLVRIDTPHIKVDPKYGGPEYETLGALGSNTGVTDLMAVCQANELVNSLGMDSISCGGTIAWAMEMAELGILSGDELEGQPLRFGAAQDMLDVIEKIAYRKGIGDLLAEGALRAARQLGKDSERYVVHVKGMEVAMHDPRGQAGFVAGQRKNYPVTPTGGDHMGAAHQRGSLPNTLGLCQFLGYDDDTVVELVNAATGWSLAPEDLREAVERGLTMARLFNLREGLTTSDDRLPARLHEPLRLGPLSGYRIPEQEIRENVMTYYEQHGWERESGKPCRDTVEFLGLDDIADALAEFDVVAAAPATRASDTPFEMQLD